MTLKTNPFDKKKQERLWTAWEEQNHNKTLLANFSRFELDEWEKKFFIPEIWERLKYIEKMYIGLNELCSTPNLARDLDIRLRPILRPEKFKISSPEPKVGEEYLQAVTAMLQNQYIKPLQDLLRKYQDFQKNPALEQVFDFLNETRFYFDSIVQTKSDPFTYHFKAFPSIKNITTGEVIADEPKEVAITLKPFEIKLNEISKVCEKSTESIDLWSQKRLERRNNLIQFSLSQSQVDVAYYQKKSTKWATWFQICTIVFTVAVIILGDRTTIYFENRSLEKEIFIKNKMISDMKTENDSIKAELAKSKNEIKELRINLNTIDPLKDIKQK